MHRVTLMLSVELERWAATIEREAIELARRNGVELRVEKGAKFTCIKHEQDPPTDDGARCGYLLELVRDVVLRAPTRAGAA